MFFLHFGRIEKRAEIICCIEIEMRPRLFLKKANHSTQNRLRLCACESQIHSRSYSCLLRVEDVASASDLNDFDSWDLQTSKRKIDNSWVCYRCRIAFCACTKNVHKTFITLCLTKLGTLYKIMNLKDIVFLRNFMRKNQHSFGT